MAGFDPDAIIAGCYAAALDAELWPAALAGLAAAVDARGALIVSHDRARTARTLHSASLCEINEGYAAGWWRHDTRIARAREIGLAPGQVWVDEHYLTPGEKRRDPFFQEFFGRHGLDNLAGFVDCDPRDGVLLSVSAPRDACKGAFEGTDLAAMGRLAPHAARAFKLGLVLGEACQRAADLGTALERMCTGTVLLDRVGRVRHVNGAAGNLADGRLGLAPGREPKAYRTHERDRLGRLLAGALPSVGAGVGASMLLRGRRTGGPLLLEALPLPATDPSLARLGVERGGALLLLREPLPRVPLAPAAALALLLEDLGLTRGEARAAVLVGRGQTPTEAADVLGVRASTVRSQLKAAYGKLGIRRQPELAILVTRLDILRPGA